MQVGSSMKKFMLGNGATKKESKYMLHVFKHTGIEFDNDNEADAYMHARMAEATLMCCRHGKPLADFTLDKQWTLCSKGAKAKKLTEAKFRKADDATRSACLGYV